jgi:two-component system, sporulation sensor kinase E
MNPYSEKLTDLYQLLVENTNNLIIVLDRETEIRAINKAFRTLLDLSNESGAIGKKLSDFSDMDVLNSILLQSLVSGQELHSYESWMTLKGKSICITIDTKIIKDISGSSTTGIMCISRNVTERKLEEQKLLTLEKQAVVGRLAAGIAHEIRNPLTAASGFIQLLLQGALGGKERTYLEHVWKEHTRISKLISDFLIVAKPSSLDLGEISVTELLRETIDLMEAQAILNDVVIDQVNTEVDAIIVGDAEQLKQLFINLIRNAIEATKKANAKITVSVEIVNASIAIWVEDEGIGIPKENISKIFDPFFTTKEDGTGVGLTGVYQIVKNHNGDISVESIEGEGTTFIIMFPLVQVR